MKDLFRKLLSELKSSNIISEQKETEILESFEKELSQYNEKIYTEASNQISDNHIKYLKRVLNKIDEQHCKSLKNVIEKIDVSACKKLKAIVEHYEAKDTNRYVKRISDYLDVVLEDVMPENDIKKFHKYKQLDETIGKIKSILMINDLKVKDEFSEAFNEAKTVISNKDKDLNKLTVENILLKKQLKQIEVAKLLDEKIKDLTPKKKAFVSSFCEGCETKTEIEEKFTEAVKAYEKDERLLREELQKSNKSVLSPKRIEEAKTNSYPEDSDMSGYLKVLNKSIKR